MIELDSRLTPSVVATSGGFIEGRFGEPLYRPFSDYSGPLEVAQLGDFTVAAAVNRVQLTENGRVLFDQYAFEEGYTGGLSVGIASDRVYVGASTGGPRVQQYDFDGNKVSDYFALDPEFRGGVTVRVFQDSVLVAANDGGGLVGVVDGEAHYYGPEDYRGPRVWGFADTGFIEQPSVLVITGTNVASFDADGSQLTAATAQTTYTSVAAGSFTFPGRNMVLGSNGDGYDEFDVTTGVVLQYYTDTHAQAVHQSEVPVPYPGSNYFVPFTLEASSGGSVGSSLGTGTITAPVYIDGRLHGLTNRHVAGEGVVTIPGRADGVPVPVGSVVRYSELDGHVDAAAFSTNVPISPVIYGEAHNRYTGQDYIVEIRPTGVAELRYGQVAYKVGRTTGLSVGVVTDTDWSGDVFYPDRTIRYSDQNLVFGFNQSFAEPGDSGSPVLVYDRGWKLAGQLFAGGSLHAIVTDITDVLATLNVEYRGA